MRVETIVPDTAQPQRAPVPDRSGFAAMLDDVGAVLAGAQSSEDAFAAGTGTLQRAVYERARADVTLAVVTAGVQRTVQSLTSILTMQV